MGTFIALYRGDPVASAKLLAPTADPRLVQYLAGRILDVPDEAEPDAVPAELRPSYRRP